MSSIRIPFSAILIAIVIHALWGGNPVGAKISFAVFPPYWSAFYRFVLGILTIVIWCRFRGYRLMPTKNEWTPLLQISVLFTLQIALMNLGFIRTSGINASILIATNPLFAALFAHLLVSRDRLTLVRTLGLLAGFSGVVITLLAVDGGGQFLAFGSAGDWLCLVSAGLLGFRLIASATAMQNLDPFRLALWQMIFSLPWFALAGATFETVNWSEMTLAPVLALVYQGVVVAGIGFMASLWLISRYQPSIMVSFNFISPVTGVLLSAWLLDETISSLVIFGVLFLAAGLIMVCWGKREATTR